MPNPVDLRPVPKRHRFMQRLGPWLILGLGLALAACGDDGKAEVRGLKEQVQRAYGNKDFSKALGLAQKGLTAARKSLGDKAPDTLYFVQAVSEANLNMRNVRGAMDALRQEMDMRAAAGQTEQRLQARRTLLIQLAEENGEKAVAGEQAVMVARGIGMGAGKDPQRVYRTETAYPPDQYRRQVEGDVEIAYSLDAAGAVTEARVAKSTPPMVFDQAALESFRKWRFTPMLDKAGQPIAAGGFAFTVAFRMKQ